MSRVRTGKTKKDRENGAVERSIANKATRAAYDRDGNIPFPSAICCGKKNTAKRHNSKAGK